MLIVLLGLFGVISKKSSKAIGKAVSYLLFTFIVPIAGNLILVLSENELLSTIGSYTYFIGMDLMAFSLFDFTLSYCNIPWRHNKKIYFIYTLLTIDVLQYFFNPFFGHAFGMEAITVDGSLYYRLVPYLGQTFHRIAVYIAFITSLGIFIYKTIRVPRIYAEKYYVILFTMVLAGIWQSYYIFSRTPIDRSMMGFAVCGMLIFYFSLFYRPFRLLDRMLANIASKMSEAIFFFDASKRCIWANSNGCKLLEVRADNLEHVNQRLFAMFDDLGVSQDNWSSKQSVGSGKDARYFTIDKHIITDAKNKKIGYFLSIQDDTEDVLKHQQEIYEATHDKLTGLFTKEHLFNQIKNKVSSEKETSYSIAYLDIKDFKMTNDIFGNEVGDSVLKRVANWIRENATKEWIFGRLSGDAFGICYPTGSVRLDVVEQRLSKFVISNGSIDQHILMHVGIYNVTNPSIDISIMFDRAHLALTTIKNEFNVHIAIYDDNMRDQVLWNQKISTELEAAIENRQVVPYLQPIVDNKGTIIGAEALVRWIHPEEGFLPPFKFIPVFEKNGMIAQVDKYIWRSACEIISSWKGDKANLFISVNISPKDFYFMDVYAEIKALVEEFKIEPSRLRIEITETVMMTEAESRMAILSKFRESGFIVEMDDFGSGYSSLNQLKDMPLDVLKIDMKFLSKAEDNHRAETILRNVLRLSSDLGLFSLTEGVETEDQYKRLNEMGCNLFQGYYFAKPMAVADFEKLCNKNKG
ncbi:MAG: EAL domain-containing protein [Fibrobacter sp.]|uniref:EAL domain-containing protein n=1 Tax=Fibrobacter sp. TaxID=35828 RepID=UPI002A91006D|nr:EAL domain-containing protein [Fibrobacter sp.]MDY6264514.1 EAL domain-containing protein [Fibrobacter sp.]